MHRQTYQNLKRNEAQFLSTTGFSLSFIKTFDKREGELIFRYIYSYLNCKKPFERLWISSLTEKAISEGLQNVKPGNQYDNRAHVQAI